MKKTIAEIAACLLILLFVYAGLSKLLDYHDFRFQLGRSPYLEKFAGFASWLMPASEIGAAVLLAFRKTRTAGFYLSFLLMLLFTGYIFIMLRYSSFLPCSCGGVLEALSWQQHFYFNIFFVILSLVGVLVLSRHPSTIEK